MSTVRTSGILPSTWHSGCCWTTWGSALQCTTICVANPTSARWLGKLRRCFRGSRKKVILQLITWPKVIRHMSMCHTFIIAAINMKILLQKTMLTFSCSVCFCRSWDKCQNYPGRSRTRGGGIWWWGFRMWKLCGSRWYHGFLHCGHCWTAHPNGFCTWEVIFKVPHSYIHWFYIDGERLMIGCHGVSGSVCQSGALPVSGLCVVSKRQEGKHVSHHPSHYCAVQCHHQPGHRVPALPACRPHLQSHFFPPASHYSSAKGPHHREVDQSSTGQSKSHSVWIWGWPQVSVRSKTLAFLRRAMINNNYQNRVTGIFDLKLSKCIECQMFLCRTVVGWRTSPL